MEDILICEKIEPGHKCNHNHGLFSRFLCNQPAVAWVGWETDITRKWPQWKYTSLFGNYLCAGHTHLALCHTARFNHPIKAMWFSWESILPAPELASLCVRVQEAYDYKPKPKKAIAD